MKHLRVSVALLCAVISFVSCSKSGDTSNPVTPRDTTTIPVTPPPTTTSYSYTYDSSFKSTGSFATMGAIQPDGKIIVGNTTQIARLNSDGTLDNSFATGNASNGEFHSLALQKDGKVLVGGNFTTYNGQSKAYYLRLNSDGSIDNAFPTLSLVPTNKPTDVKSIAIQPDNKILLGGSFLYILSNANGINTGPKYIVRLNSNGSYDNSFQTNVTAEYVNCMRILTDGKILVTGQYVSAGYFIKLDSLDYRSKIFKLNPDGSADPSFKWSTDYFTMILPYTYLQAYGQIIAVQDDGKILLGGRFQKTSSIASDDYKNLVRLKADGSIDNTFKQWIFDAIVPALCMTSDRLVIGTMHDPDRAYTTANTAIFQANKDGTENANYKTINFLNYGDAYLILEDANKNLVLFGKFYDRLIGVVTFHGIIRLKKI